MDQDSEKPSIILEAPLLSLAVIKATVREGSYHHNGVLLLRYMIPIVIKVFYPFFFLITTSSPLSDHKRG